MSSITNNPLQALLQQTGQLTSYFSQGSRYYTTEVATYTPPNGNEVKYIRRRFAPSADEFVLLRTHTVTEGERLDNITSQYLGDPLQFWQICDANNALDPTGLTDPAGRQLRITLPRGIPGNPNNA